MASQLYQIVFSGELADGYEADTVKQNISRLFNADPKVVDTLFSGRPLVIKQGIDYETAIKYMSVLASAGGISKMQPMLAAETGSAQQATDRRQETRRLRPSRRKQERVYSIQPDRRVNPDRRRNSGDK